MPAQRWIYALSAGAALAGCWASLARGQPAPPVKTPESVLLSPDDQALRRKLQPFVHCLNTVAGELPYLARTYRHAFAVQNKNPHESEVYVDYSFAAQYSGGFLFRGDALAKCTDGLSKVAGMPPPDPDLEALASRYPTDLQRLGAVAPKVETYYKEKNYRDDNMAAGRAMNVEYEQVLKQVLADTHLMFAEVDKRNDIIDEHRVDAIAQHDGKHGRWEANAFMLQARVTMRTLDRLVADKTLGRDQVAAAVRPLEARYEEAKAYFDAHPEENTEDMTLWKEVSADAPDVVTDAKEVRRDAADGNPADEIVRKVDSMRNEYNRAINDANSSKR